MDKECIIKKRDKEIRKRKERETARKSKEDQEHVVCSKFKDRREVTLSSVKELKIKKIQVKRKNSSRLLYTINQ